MTETTRRDDGTDALSYRVTLHQRETYIAVKFTFGNTEEGPITVDYHHRVPSDLTQAEVSFASTYMGDAWTFEDSSLKFSTSLDSGEQIETVYGIKTVESPELIELIGDSKAVIRQDGYHVGTLTDIEPEVPGGQAAAPSAKGGPTSDAAADATGDEQQTGRGDNNDTQAADDQESGESVSSRPVQTAGSGRSQSANGDAGEPVGTNSIEWETLTDTASEDTSVGETATESANPGDTGSADAPTADERPPALPANRADYVLEDVRGEIESAAEFEWIDRGPSEDSDDTQGGTGVLGWVRSHLPI